jgi:hypothetical protein
LQIVDEIVTLEDVTRIARDVGAALTYFNTISVWKTNDYVHAMIERDGNAVRPILLGDVLPIKGLPRRTFFNRAWSRIGDKSRLFTLLERRRRRQIRKALGSSKNKD